MVGAGNDSATAGEHALHDRRLALKLQGYLLPRLKRATLDSATESRRSKMEKSGAAGTGSGFRTTPESSGSVRTFSGQQIHHSDPASYLIMDKFVTCLLPGVGTTGKIPPTRRALAQGL